MDYENNNKEFGHNLGLLQLGEQLCTVLRLRNPQMIVNNVDVDLRKAHAYFTQQLFYYELFYYAGNGIFQILPNNTTLKLLKYSQHSIDVSQRSQQTTWIPRS